MDGNEFLDKWTPGTIPRADTANYLDDYNNKLDGGEITDAQVGEALDNIAELTEWFMENAAADGDYAFWLVNLDVISKYLKERID